MIGKTNAANGKPSQTKTLEFNPGSANSITITPDAGYVLSAVEVGKPATMIPENIKKDVNIGGVIGTFKGGVDTSDATAMSNDILLGKTAYANDEKVVGTIPTYNNEHENGYIVVTLKKLLDTRQSANYLFKDYTGTSVDDLIQPNDTENVTSMCFMFKDCSNLTSILQLNTSNVTNMEAMFMDCSKLTTIPLLDTSKVENMNSMFGNCKALTSIPLLDISKINDMSYMFYGCKSLTAIPELNANSVTNSGGLMNIFGGCTKLKSILMTNIGVNLDISASTKFERSDLLIILNNLKTVTSTRKLTMGSTNLGKLTNEDKAIATNKG